MTLCVRGMLPAQQWCVMSLGKLLTQGAHGDTKIFHGDVPWKIISTSSKRVSASTVIFALPSIWSLVV